MLPGFVDLPKTAPWICRRSRRGSADDSVVDLPGSRSPHRRRL